MRREVARNCLFRRQFSGDLRARSIMEKKATLESAIAGLLPVYTTSVPDEALNLCQRRLGVRQGGYYGEGEGTIDVVWSSGPHLRFDIPSLTPFGTVDAAECVLAIPSLNAEAAANISNSRVICGEAEQSVGVRGEVNRNLVIGKNGTAGHVIFHVVNFWPYFAPRPANAPPDYHVGRVAFEGGGWKVTLQTVPDLRQLLENLHASSGYGITHAGKAEHIDGSPISPDDASDLFNALYSFLSFAKGSWSPPILYIGVAQDGSHVWQDWSVRHASPWKPVDTWFPEHEPECLAKLFPGFMRIWLDVDRRDILRVAIYWYVEANVAWGIEGAVMLCQSGLERLAYYIMVHEERLMSEKDFEPKGKPSAERLRGLLTHFNLPTGIGPPRPRVQQLPALAVARLEGRTRCVSSTAQ